MSGNHAARRAAETKDAIRLTHKIPLITDATELITPEKAMEMLKKNQHNRPVNWRKVDEYTAIMKAGKWELTAQGIVLDTEDNILTGQKRLIAVTRAGVAVLFRISRGYPASTAKLLDRGDPQSARDLAARDTERKHSPVESSIARAIAVLAGLSKPTADDLAELMVKYDTGMADILTKMHRTKKNRALLMILACIAVQAADDATLLERLVERAVRMAELLEKELQPESADRCWGKGVAFGLAMRRAKAIVEGA